MKKIILALFIMAIKCNCISQTILTAFSHEDSITIEKNNTICTNKATYIGQPLSLLFDNIYRPFEFGIPDNLGGYKSCKANVYFKDFSLYLPAKDSDGVYSLTIHLVNKVSSV